MDIKVLQRLIVDGLEDVKGQDIKVFDTTHLTSLFDRVIIASGTSNRQTRSLAGSVADKVREGGGKIVSTEGGDTGEWVLVDCGDAIVHILQPALRQYYNLEELWGGKPVRVTTAAAKAATARKTAKAAREAELEDEDDDTVPVVSPSRLAKPALARAMPEGHASQTSEETPRKPAARKTASKTAPRKVASKTAGAAAPRKTAVKSAAVKSPAAKKAVARKAPAVRRKSDEA